MLLKIDFHVHTNASPDGLSTVEEIIRSAKNRELDGIAITDHNTMDNVKNAVKLGKRLGLLVIPGEELRTKDGDVLIFGLKDPLSRGMSVSDALSMLAGQNTAVFVAHPYSLFFHSVSSMHSKLKKYDFDGVEIFNSRTYISNYKAAKFAFSQGLSVIAGSDAHHHREVGNSYTIVQTDKRSVESVISALKNGKTKIVCGRTPLTHVFSWYAKRVVSSL